MVAFQARDDNLTTPMSLPYFEGDFWPNVIEDCIRYVVTSVETGAADNHLLILSLQGSWKRGGTTS